MEMLVPDRFEDFIADYQKFLMENGYPVKVAWITPADVTSKYRRTWVRWFVSETNLEEVKRLYEIAKNGLGARIDGYLKVDDYVCSIFTLQLPEDDHTGRLCSGGIYFAALTTLNVAQPVYNRLR